MLVCEGKKEGLQCRDENKFIGETSHGEFEDGRVDVLL
jgi:hypothetical protein